MYSPKHIVEYILLRFITSMVNLLPESAALGLGSLGAKVVINLSPTKRTEAMRRIRQVFGDDVSEIEARRIIDTSFRDLAWHTIEILRTPKMTPDWVKKNVVITDSDRSRLDDAIALEKGVVLAVAHLANWDLGGIELHQLGYPMTFLVRSQKNPLFDRYLNRLRELRGAEVVERDDPMLVRKVIRSLRGGNVVAIMVDLRARQKDLELPFLGHTADLMRGVGVISHLSGCPVVPAYTSRLTDGRHQIHFKETIFPDPEPNRNEDAERIVRQSLVPLEAAIREHPEQYFWFNKRWVLEQIEDSAA